MPTPLIRLSQIRKNLDGVIAFRSQQDPPPEIDSWNPIKRHIQHQHLKQWVDSRKPSAGITAEQLEKLYPENLKEKHAIRKGMAIGGGVGAVGAGTAAAIFSHMHLKGGSRLTKAGLSAGSAALGGTYGALVGGVVGDYPYSSKRATDYHEAWSRLAPAISGPDAVPASSLKSKVPRATTYREVSGELKKQGVGFVPRHATALATRPLAWSGDNAAFVPRGDKGLIVTSGKVHPAVFRHEAGHATDYKHYGGQAGFAEAYPDYGNPFAGRKEIIESTMLPEHRAWAYAKPKGKKEKQLRDDALTTYRTMMGLSARLDSIIEFEDDRDDDRRSGALPFVAGAGVGAGGLLGHQAIKRAGGYGLLGHRIADYAGGLKGTYMKAAMRSSWNPGGSVIGDAMAGARAAGTEVAQGAKSVAGTALSGAAKKVTRVASRFLQSGKLDRLVQLNAKLDEIYG